MNKGVLIGLLFGLMLGVSVYIDGIQSDYIGDAVTYHATVCTYKNGELLGCNHNVLTDTGKNLIKNTLGQGDTVTINVLALGNGTAPTSSDSSLPGEITACGLAKGTGTFYDNGVGNWSIVKTWTSTCNGVLVTTTGLYNASGNNLFAGASITSTTLYTNDQITINYTIAVS